MVISKNLNKIAVRPFINYFMIIGILLVVIVSFTALTKAETKIDYEDFSPDYVKAESDPIFVFHLSLYNNSQGQGNKLNWINITVTNNSAISFDPTEDFLPLDSGGIDLQNKSGAVSHSFISWFGSGPKWYVNISGILREELPSDMPAEANYFMIIRTNNTINNNAKFNISIESRMINATYGSVALNDISSKVITADTEKPIVNAGSDEVRNASFSTTSIDRKEIANASDSLSGIAAYHWSSEDSEIAFGEDSNISTSVSASSDGTYSIKLKVKDRAGNSAFKTFSLTWDTTAPSVDAGSNEICNASFFSTSNGRDVIATADDALSGIEYYEWSSESTEISFGDSNALSTSISSSHDGIFPITLKVTDEAGNFNVDSFSLTWDTLVPDVEAGSDEVRNVLFSTTSSDRNEIASANGGISEIASFEWSGINQIVFSDEHDISTSISASIDGVYIITLTVTDGAGNSASDIFTLTWDTTPPNVFAGSNETRNSSFMTLSGRAEIATVSDSLSGIASYRWSADPRVSFGNRNDISTSISASLDDNYQISLTVTDNAANSASHSFLLKWDTTPPIILPTKIIESSDYLYAPDDLSKLYYSDGMGFTKSRFIIEGISYDTSSGITGAISFSSAFNEQPPQDSSPIIWRVSYNITAESDETENILISIIDKAGNRAIYDLPCIKDISSPDPVYVTMGSPSYETDTLYINSSTKISLVANEFGSGLSAIEYMLDSNGWMSYLSPFTINAGGKHTLRLRAKDNVLNVGPLEVVEFTVDDSAPVTEITFNAPRYESHELFIIPSSTKIALNASDEGSGVHDIFYNINGIKWETYDGPFPILEEGYHTIYFKSVDKIGNTEYERHIIVYGDNSSPTSFIQVSGPWFEMNDRNFVTASTQFSISSSDLGSGVSNIFYSLDNTYPSIPYTMPFTTNESTIRIRYRAIDHLGNGEVPKRLMIGHDNTPPVTPSIILSEPNVDNYYISSETSITIPMPVDTDSGWSRSEYSINGSDWINYTMAFTVPNHGPIDLLYRSRDNIGNVESSQFLQLFVDTIGPTAEILIGLPHVLSNPSYVGKNTQFSVSPKEGLSGKATPWIQINEESRIIGVENEVYSFNLSDYQQGEHIIAYGAMDTFGNDNLAGAIHIYLDVSPPASEIRVSGPQYDADSSLFVTSGTQFSITASDNKCGVSDTYYSIDEGVQWQRYSGPFTIDVSTSLIKYYSVDDCGNSEIIQDKYVTVDDTPPATPSITLSGPNFDNHYISSETSITIPKPVETGSGWSRSEYSINGSDWINYTGAFTVPNHGQINFLYRSRDNIGNVEPSQFLQLFVDTIGPTAEIQIGLPHVLSDPSYVGKNTQFSVSPKEGLSGKATPWIQVNGESRFIGFENEIYSFTFADYQQGEHIIAYGAMDAFGNDNLAGTIHIYLDVSPPASEIRVSGLQYEGHDTLFVTSNTQFSITAADNECGVSDTYYSIDEGAHWKRYSGTFTINEGTSVIRYYSVDDCGNSEMVREKHVMADITPPETSEQPQYSEMYVDLAGRICIRSRTMITIPIPEDDESGYCKTEYMINDGSWIEYHSAFSLKIDGSVRMLYRSIDNVQNVESLNVVELYVDNIGPSVNLVHNNEEIIAPQKVHHQSLISVEPISDSVKNTTPWYIIDGRYEEGEENSALLVNLSDLPLGEYSIVYGAYDPIGNNNTIGTIIIEIKDNSSDSDSINWMSPILLIIYIFILISSGYYLAGKMR